MKFSAILGPAGSGKSTQMRENARATGDTVKLCATTGIAAINLGPSVTTLNSVLGFYDEDSLAQSKSTGRFAKRLIEVSQMHTVLAVDEISMLSASVFDSIVDGFIQLEYEGLVDPPDLLAIGDFLQLPPVKGKFAFQSRAWERFKPNTTTLTGSYRQKDDPAFFEALNFARAGKGVDCVIALRKAGVTYRALPDPNFSGLTIAAINTSVDKMNRERYATISSVEQLYMRTLWGYSQSDWNAIPGQVGLKEGAYVMVLCNMKDRETGELEYGNGDTGIVSGMEPHGVHITLSRNDERVFVPFVTRKMYRTTAGLFADAIWDEREKRYLVGTVNYLPVRLAYASTIHKSQGLTLDKVQIDARTRFAGEPGMMYTALSRCRSAKDVVIVCKTAGDFASRIRTHTEVRAWI